MKNIEIKKYVIPNLPYVMMFWIFSKIAESYRLSAGADVVTKAMAAILHWGRQSRRTRFPASTPVTCCSASRGRRLSGRQFISKGRTQKNTGTAWNMAAPDGATQKI